MRRWSLVLVHALIASGILADGTPAFAQFGPGGGGMPPGGGAPTAPGGEEKEEGPAEAAPEEKAESPALQPLPAWPQQREKTLQFFQLNGYMRFRTYLFHNLNLDYYEANNGSGVVGPRSPFHIPISEIGSNVMGNGIPPVPSCQGQNKGVACHNNDMTSADMRLRLEPTVNVTEQVRVKAQLDVFDNLVLGSTPQGWYTNGMSPGSANLPFFSNTQAAPQQGVNSTVPSIVAKRAWAEVRTPFGELRFGRMPNHWGMGMVFNNGDCLDCDYGDNVDRVMFATKLWGHFFAFLWDWAATGPTTNMIGFHVPEGQPDFNAEPLLNTSQWILSLGKIDKPEELKEKLDAGRAVFNYGGYFVYRHQAWDLSSFPQQTFGNSGLSIQQQMVPRAADMFLPDIWLRLNWKKLHLEAEGAMQVGKIGYLTDQFPTVKGPVNLLSGGFVVKGDYRLLHDALKIYLEVGYASGDSAEDPNAILNFGQQNIQPFNNTMNRFGFNPDYHVDLILFRRILGTVNNATYFKPGVSYDIIDNFGARVDIMYALANQAVGYPGNSNNLGLEIDAALMYKNEEEGFYAGVVYGVLFPFAALSFPAAIYGTQFAHDPGTAQTLQARLYVKF